MSIRPPPPVTSILKLLKTFLVLGSVAPVTQSVGNTVKRVVVIVAAALAFKTPMTPIGIVGSSIAIGGVLLYSVVKGKFPDPPAKKEE